MYLPSVFKNSTNFSDVGIFLMSNAITCPFIPQFLLLSPKRFAPPNPQQLNKYFSFLASTDSEVKISLLKEALPV